MLARRFMPLSNRIRRFGTFQVCHLHHVVRSLAVQLEKLPEQMRGNCALRAIRASEGVTIQVDLQRGSKGSSRGSWHTRNLNADGPCGKHDEVYQLAIVACWCVTGLKPQSKEQSLAPGDFFREALHQTCNSKVAELLLSVLDSTNVVFESVSAFLDEMDLAVSIVCGWQTGARIQKNQRSSVYSARNEEVDSQERVIKILHAKYANDERQLGRFFIGAKIPMENPFNGMPVVEEVGSDGPYFYAIMPRLSGRTLEETVLANGTHAADLALEKINHICEVMERSHQRGIIHRNLHPANVFVGHGGKITVTGWGTALRQDAEFDLVRKGAGAGHPAYSSPEQMTDATSADASSDVFAIGSILYFMLTGEAPFSTDSQRICLLQKTKSLRWREALIEKQCPAYLVGLFDRIFRKRHKRMIKSARHLANISHKIRHLLIEDEESRAPLQQGDVVSRTGEKLSELTTNLLDRHKSVLQTVYDHTFSDCY